MARDPLSIYLLLVGFAVVVFGSLFVAYTWKGDRRAARGALSLMLLVAVIATFAMLLWNHADGGERRQSVSASDIKGSRFGSAKQAPRSRSGIATRGEASSYGQLSRVSRLRTSTAQAAMPAKPQTVPPSRA